MTKYKLCKEVGLPVVKVYTGMQITDEIILASEVEALLQNGVRVYGCKPAELNCYVMSKEAGELNKFSGLLIDYKPIRKKVMREEITRALDNSDADFEMFSELLKRIESEGLE